MPPAIFDSASRPTTPIRLSSIADAGSRRPSFLSNECLVQVQHVEAGACGRGHSLELLGEPRSIIHHEAFGDQDDGLWFVDLPQLRQQIAQSDNRTVRLIERLAGNLAGVVSDAAAAHRVLITARREVDALPGDGAVEHAQLAVQNRQRFAKHRRYTWSAHLAAVRPDRRVRQLLGAFAIRQEHQRRRTSLGEAVAEADHADAIGRQQLVDERRQRGHHRRAAAEADTRLIDGDDDQPAAAGIFVGGIAFGDDRRRPTRPLASSTTDTHSALSTRRSSPSIQTLKSPTPSPVIGRPALSTTVTSTSGGDVDGGLETRRLLRRERRRKQARRRAHDTHSAKPPRSILFHLVTAGL